MAELRWKNWPVDVFHINNNITGEFAATAPDPPWRPDRPHMGLDVGVNVGTRVVAPAAGTVVPFANDGSFGIGVCIQHDSDPAWFSLFAHLSEALVSIGARVEAGQLVALSGDTPNVAPHLHWQVCRTSMFVRDLQQNRDPLAVPFELTEEEEMGMTDAEKAIVMALAERISRLEAVVGGNGIDSDGDGVTDKFGEEALAWASNPDRAWSAFQGIAEAKLEASRVKVALFEHDNTPHTHN